MTTYIGSTLGLLVNDILRVLFINEGPDPTDSTNDETKSDTEVNIFHRKGFLLAYLGLDVSLLATTVTVFMMLVLLVRCCRRKKVPSVTAVTSPRLVKLFDGQFVGPPGHPTVARTTAPTTAEQLHSRHKYIPSDGIIFTSIKEEEEGDDDKKEKRIVELPLKPVKVPLVQAAPDDLLLDKKKTNSIIIKSKENSIVKFSDVENSKTTLSKKVPQSVCVTSQKLQKEPMKPHQHGYTYASPRRKDTDYPKYGKTHTFKGFKFTDPKKRFKRGLLDRKLHQIKNRIAHPTVQSSLKTKPAVLKELDQHRQRSIAYRIRLPEGGKFSSPSPLSANVKPQPACSVQFIGNQYRKASPAVRSLFKKSKPPSSTPADSCNLNKLNSERQKQRDVYSMRMDWPTFFKTREAVRRNIKQKSPKKMKIPLKVTKSRKGSGPKKIRKISKTNKGNIKDKSKPMTVVSKIGTYIKPARSANCFVHMPEPSRGLHVPAQFGTFSALSNLPGSFTIKRTATPVLSSLLGQGAFRTLWPHNVTKSSAPTQELNENVNTGRHNTKFLGPKIPDSNTETTETINSSKTNKNSVQPFNSTADEKVSSVSVLTKDTLQGNNYCSIQHFPVSEKHVLANIFSMQKNMETEQVSSQISSVETRQRNECKTAAGLGSLKKIAFSDAGVEKNIVGFCTTRNDKLKLSSIYPLDEAKDTGSICIKHNLQSSELLSKSKTGTSGTFGFKLTSSSMQCSNHPVTEQCLNFKSAASCVQEKNTVQKCLLTNETNCKVGRDEVGKGQRNQDPECSFQFPRAPLLAKDQDNRMQISSISSTLDRKLVLANKKNEQTTDPVCTVTSQAAASSQCLENMTYMQTRDYQHLKNTSIIKEGNVFRVTRKNMPSLRPPNDHSKVVQESTTTQAKHHQLFQPSYCLQSGLQNKIKKCSDSCKTETRNECSAVTQSEEARQNDISSECSKPLVYRYPQPTKPPLKADVQVINKRMSKLDDDKLLYENKHSTVLHGVPIQHWTLGSCIASNAQHIPQPITKTLTCPGSKKWISSNVLVHDRLNQSNSSVSSTVEVFSGASSDCLSHQDFQVSEKCIQPSSQNCSHYLVNTSEKPDQNYNGLYDSHNYKIVLHHKDQRSSMARNDKSHWKFPEQQATGNPVVKINAFRGHAVKKTKSLISLRNMLNELTSHVQENQAVKQSSKSSHIRKPQGKTLLYFQPIRGSYKQSLPEEERNNQNLHGSLYFPVFKNHDILRSIGNFDSYEKNDKYIKFYRPRKIKLQRHEPYKKHVLTSGESTTTPSCGEYWTKNKNNCSPSRRGRYFLGPVVEKHLFVDQEQQSERNTSPRVCSNNASDQDDHQQDNASSSGGAVGYTANFSSDKRNTQIEHATTQHENTDTSVTEDADEVQTVRGRHDIANTLFPLSKPTPTEQTLIEHKASCHEPVGHSLKRYATRHAVAGQITSLGNSRTGQKFTGNSQIGHSSTGNCQTEHTCTGKCHTEHTCTVNCHKLQTFTGSFLKEQKSTSNPQSGRPCAGNVIRRHTVVGQAGQNEASCTITRRSSTGIPASGPVTTKLAIAEVITDGRTAGDNTIAGHKAIERKTIGNPAAVHKATESTTADHTTARHTTREHKSVGHIEAGNTSAWQNKVQKEQLGQQNVAVKLENPQSKNELLFKSDNCISSKSKMECQQQSSAISTYLPTRKTLAELPVRRGQFSSVDKDDASTSKSRTTYRFKGLRLPHTRIGRIKSQLSISRLRGICRSQTMKNAGSFERESRGSMENVKKQLTFFECDNQLHNAVEAKEDVKSTPATQNHMTQTESLIASVHVGVQTSPHLHVTPKRSSHSCKVNKYFLNSKLFREKIRHKELSRHRQLRRSCVDTIDGSSPSTLHSTGINVLGHPKNVSQEARNTLETVRWDHAQRQTCDNQTVSSMTAEIQERERPLDCTTMRGHPGPVADNETQKITHSLEHRQVIGEKPARQATFSNPRDRQEHRKEDLKGHQEIKKDSTDSRTESTTQDLITTVDNRLSDDWKRQERTVSEIQNQHNSISQEHVTSHDDQAQDPQYVGNSEKQKYRLCFDKSQSFMNKSETNNETNSVSQEGTNENSRGGAAEATDSSLMSFRLSELRKFCVIKPVWKNANIEEIDRRVKRALRLREELKQTGSSGERARSLIASYFEASAADDVRGGTSSNIVSDFESTNRSTYFPATGVEPSSFPDTASDDTLCQTVEQSHTASRRMSSSESEHTAQEETAAEFAMESTATETVPLEKSFCRTGTEFRSSCGATANQKQEKIFSEGEELDRNELSSRMENSISFREETASELTSRLERPSSAQVSSHPSNSNSGNSIKRAGIRHKNSPPTKIPKVDNKSTCTSRLVGALVQKLPQVPLTSFVEWFIETSDPNNFVASDRSSSSSDNSPIDLAFCPLRAPASGDDLENSSMLLDPSYDEAHEHDAFLGGIISARPFNAPSGRKTHVKENKTRNQNGEHEVFVDMLKLNSKNTDNISIVRKSYLPRSVGSTVPARPSSVTTGMFSLSSEVEEKPAPETNSRKLIEGKLVEGHVTPANAMQKTGILKCKLKPKFDETPSSKLKKGVCGKFSSKRIAANNLSFNKGTSRQTNLQKYVTARQSSFSSRRQLSEDVSMSDTSNERVLQSTDTVTNSELDCVCQNWNPDLSKLLSSSNTKDSSSPRPDTTSQDKSKTEIANCSMNTYDQSGESHSVNIRNQMRLNNSEITRAADRKQGAEHGDQTELAKEQSARNEQSATQDINGDNRCAPGIRHILMKLHQMTDTDDSAVPRPERMKITLRKSSDVTGIIAKFQNKKQ